MCPSIYKESHCINACLVWKLHPSPADATELEMRSYYLRRRGIILYQGIIQNCKPTFIMLLVLVITSIFHYCTFMKTQQKSKVDVQYLSVSTIEFTWQIPYFGFNNVQQAPKYEDVPTGTVVKATRYYSTREFFEDSLLIFICDYVGECKATYSSHLVTTEIFFSWP